VTIVAGGKSEISYWGYRRFRETRLDLVLDLIATITPGARKVTYRNVVVLDGFMSSHQTFSHSS